MKLPILYKMSATGKISEWEVEAVEDNPCYYIIRHGYQDGLKQEKCVEVPAGKNIGRANETSMWEQCQAEAKSRWTKQRDRQGYTETIPKNKPLRPMLAKSYNKVGSSLDDLKDGKHIKWPCYYQPKLDGLRCLALKRQNRVVLMSRKGKQFTVLQHIGKELEKIMDDNSILDGELYKHGEDFQKIVSAVKRDDPSADTSSIEYHVYDCITIGNFEDRFNYLFSLLIKDKKPVSDLVKLVWTKEIESKDDLPEVFAEQIKRGYEGVILRNKDGSYTIDKRSKDLQKVKTFMEEEFVIIGAKENPKMPGTCSFKCKTQYDTEFDCMPEGDEFQRQKYWKDWQDGKIKYGDLLTVRYFGLTLDWKPRFPVGKTIRDYE